MREIVKLDLHPGSEPADLPPGAIPPERGQAADQDAEALLCRPRTPDLPSGFPGLDVGDPERGLGRNLGECRHRRGEKAVPEPGARPPCWFWRTVQGEEIDLLVERGPGQFLAVECKTSEEIEPRMLKGFTALERTYGPKALRQGAVVCRTPAAYPLTEKGRITALPLGGSEGLRSWVDHGVSG